MISFLNWIVDALFTHNEWRQFNHYKDNKPVPKEIVVGKEPENIEILETVGPMDWDEFIEYNKKLLMNKTEKNSD